jgi:hypothetical protein
VSDVSAFNFVSSLTTDPNAWPGASNIDLDLISLPDLATHPAVTSFRPRITILCLSTDNWFRSNTPFLSATHTQLRSINFPAPVSDETRTAVPSLPGLTYRYGLSIDSSSQWAREQMAYVHEPVTPWVTRITPLHTNHKHPETHLFEEPSDDHKDKVDKEIVLYGPRKTVTRQGKECEVAMAIMFWKDEARERHFHDSETVAVLEPGPIESKLTAVGRRRLLREWEDRLKELGAVGWTDEWVDFQEIGNKKWPA